MLQASSLSETQVKTSAREHTQAEEEGTWNNSLQQLEGSEAKAPQRQHLQALDDADVPDEQPTGNAKSKYARLSFRRRAGTLRLGLRTGSPVLICRQWKRAQRGERDVTKRENEQNEHSPDPRDDGGIVMFLVSSGVERKCESSTSRGHPFSIRELMPKVENTEQPHVRLGSRTLARPKKTATRCRVRSSSNCETPSTQRGRSIMLSFAYFHEAPPVTPE